MLDNIASDEANLEAKIDKKKQELERNQKRLRSLETVRPAYMDEYEKLEEELKKVYETFMEKHRNLSYLEQLLEDINRAEQDRFEESEATLRNMQTGDRDQVLGGGGELGELDDEGDEEGEIVLEANKPRQSNRPQAAEAGGRVFGSMGGGGLDSDEDESGSLSSGESDIGVEDDDEELLDDDDMDEGRGEGQDDGSQANSLNDSDNDF